MNDAPQPPVLSGQLPYDHPDYEFPKEVHNLLVTAQNAHVQMSAMADTKASILMGATFVVFTLAIGEITSSRITLPLSLLGGFSFLASVLSVLAIRPKIANPPRFLGRGANRLYFGAFTGLPEDEYIDQIIDVMRTEEATYRAMARDLYQNGQVLQNKKYKYLFYAYTLFLTGLISTFVAFVGQLIMDFT